MNVFKAESSRSCDNSRERALPSLEHGQECVLYWFLSLAAPLGGDQTSEGNVWMERQGWVDTLHEGSHAWPSLFGREGSE